MCLDIMRMVATRGVTGFIIGKDKGKMRLGGRFSYDTRRCTYHRVQSRSIDGCLGCFRSLSPGLSWTGHCIRAGTK